MSAAVAPPSSAPPGGTRPTRARRADAVRDTGVVRRETVRTENWSLTGLAKVQGNVEVGTGDSNGSLSVAGRLTADAFRARGTTEVVGPIDVRSTLTLNGTAQLGAGGHAGNLEARGTLRSGGPVRVDRALIAHGVVEAPSISAGLFDLTGSVLVPGELLALGVVRARFRGDSRIGTVRAQRVALDGPPTALIPTLWRSVFGGAADVRVDRVEADSVELSAVDVGFVRAREIVLGAGAHVTTVEGTIVRRHRTSRVGPESRTPAPHGLFR